MDGTAERELAAVRLLCTHHRTATKQLAARRNRAIAAALAAGLTQTEVARLLGITRQAVAQHMDGGTA